MKYLAILCLLFISNAFPAETTQKAANGDPLFTLLSPKQTRIDFNNELKDTKEHNILIYSNYYGGAGVGLGDINNDGLQDIFFAGNLVADQLYLNKGNMTFENITKKAGIIDNGGWSSGVVMGDVNQDGLLDIYVTRELYDDEPELRRNKLYINNGDNTFSEKSKEYGVDNSERTRHATFLDYDKDGDLDLFLLNQPPNPGDYSPFLKTELILEEYNAKLYAYENGRFEDVTVQAGLNKTGFPNSVSAADINGDGWTDLFVANDFWIGDWYYINNGDGTFTDKIHDYVRHTSFSSMGVDAADINNDGKLDIAVVDMVAEDNYRLKTNMSGMNPKAFWKVVDEGGHYQYMFNMLHLNIGGGYLSDIAQMAGVASTDWSWSTLIADLDNDGWKDIFITNGLMRDIRNNDASKAFAKKIESAVQAYLKENPNPEGVGIWDIVDVEEVLKLTPSEKLHNYVFKNNGDLTFSKKIEEWGFEQKTFSNGAAYADLDNDGDLDLVVNNVNDQASVYENKASERKDAKYIRVQAEPGQGKVAILGTKIWAKTKQGEQFYEISGVRGMYSTSETLAHFGLGKEEVVEEIRVRWPDGKENRLQNLKAGQTVVVKYGDAKVWPPVVAEPKSTLLEKITAQSGINYRHEENEFDDYRSQVLLPHKMSTLGPCLAKGDVNGDGLEDFFIGGAATKPGQLFVQTTNGKFEALANEVFTLDKIREDMGAVFFDFDQDGDSDLYVVSGGNEFFKNSDSYQDRLYVNDGTGRFFKGEDLLPEMKFSGSKVYPQDFDRDGDLDLFVAGRHIPWSYPEPASSVLLKNEGGKFEDATAELAVDLIDVGMINDASWFDYDADGWQDLVLVGEWTPLIVLKNQKGRFEKMNDSEVLNESKGWWFSVETADMDGDGDMDIIAGNLGLNYKYKASKEEPFEVYYYDFDESGAKDVVLTYYNFGIQYPLRGRQCSSEQVPQLKEKFPTYDLFADSDVAEIYGANSLEAALHYEATTFASAWFENQDGGQFKRHSLPAPAQLSSVNDILIDDFNDDGRPDILLAGNLYNAEVETARNDAGYGLLLTGDGKGRFMPLAPEESGFFAPYNVKSMNMLESRAGKLVLVGCNDANLQVFKFSRSN